MLEARNLRFSYGKKEKLILADVSFLLRPGEMAAVVGPNGCGKSTLIKLLAGVLQPEAGGVFYYARPFAALTRQERVRALAYVPQTFSRSFPFSVLEVVLSGRFPHLSGFHAENAADRAIAQQALALIGASSLQNRSLNELSGGELQMVSVARALAQEPACLLLDEAASSLDLKHTARLIRILRDLRITRGTAILMVTHDLSSIEPFFDTVHCLQRGRPLLTDTPSACLRPQVLADVFEDPAIRIDRLADRTFVWSEA